MLPKNDHNHQWQQLFLALSCSPIAWRSSKREASISQALGLQLGVTTSCKIWHTGNKNTIMILIIKPGAAHWTELCVSGLQILKVPLRKEETKNKTAKKIFFYGAAWSKTANRCVGASVLCRELNSATRGVGCLPQADWKKCLNRVCCVDVTQPVLQGTGSTRPSPQSSYFHLRADVREHHTFLLLPLPVSSSHCSQQL